MSSIMRWRSGLMGFSLTWCSCLEVEVLDPLILKTGHRPVAALGLPVHMHPLPLAPLFARSALPRKRVRSVIRLGHERPAFAAMHSVICYSQSVILSLGV